MAFFQACFDESGTHDTRSNLVVSGFVASNHAWKRFGKKWDRCLEKYEVPYFKAQWFAKRKEFFAGPKWKDRDYCIKFMGRLLAIIENAEATPFSCSIPVADFNEIVPPGTVRNKLGSAYTIACQWCIGATGAWAKDNNYDDPIAFCFDDGHKNRREFEEAYKKEKDEAKKEFRLGSLSRADERETPPLQAADLFAYEVAQYGIGMKDRHPFGAILDTAEKNDRVRKFTRKSLIEQRNRLMPDNPFVER